jgi:hypothetical protein
MHEWHSNWEIVKARGDVADLRAQRVGWHLRELELGREMHGERSRREIRAGQLVHWLGRAAQAAAAWLL